MLSSLDDIAIDTVAAETEKFAAPLILLHGLWCTAVMWRRFMGFLSHRGWTCHAVHLPRPPAADWQTWQGVVSRVVSSCTAPPVLVGHDAGAILALAQPHAAAAVALAPLLQADLAAARTLRVRWQQWRHARVAPPRGGSGRDYFGADVPGGLCAEAAGILRTLPASLPASPTLRRHPTLILRGRNDGIGSATTAERLAAQSGATALPVDAAHAMVWERGWDQRAAEVHRWIVKQLGEPLLLMRDEDEQS